MKVKRNKQYARAKKLGSEAILDGHAPMPIYLGRELPMHSAFSNWM